eukprot:TRINITY_DN1412_c0_g2_i1.p1 TRINITY_DN1412_c0_g2~~TRINITY_DN1412_c0_g2_i1.p1  ORF type:complete len:640 (+),score=73.32 TRINITY_DN1412_c0_g2_i1:64-1983(+)
MFKEILVNLLGYKGSFVTTDHIPGAWGLHKDLHIDKGTRQLVEELLVLGPVVEGIRTFLEEVEKGTAAGVSEKLYAHSFCEGISEIIGEYEKSVEELYSQAEDANMSLGQIKSTLTPWFETLPSLSSLIIEVKSRPTHILTIVESAVRFGTSRQSHLSILKKVNTVLLRHIAEWVIWGSLPSQPGFFIETGPELVPLFQPSFIPTHLSKKLLTIGSYAKRIRVNGSSLLAQDSFTLYSCITSSEVLRDGPLNVSLLEDLITHTEQIIGHDLWRTVYLGKEGLETQLKGIGEFLLCFKGDFWRDFAVGAVDILARLGLHALDTHLDDRHALKTKEKIEGLFVKIASKLKDQESRALVEKVTFKYVQDQTTLGKLLEPTAIHDKNSVSVRFSNYLLTATRMMKLTYSLQPHHLDLFGEAGMELLHNTFSHSLYLVFTEVMLSNVWSCCISVTKQLENETRRGGKDGSFRTKNDAKIQAGIDTLKPLLCLRRKMGFFIENLKFYVVTDVLHARFSQLERELKDNARTFEQAKLFIKQALDKVTRDAFLADPGKSNQMILLTIRKAVRCCLQLWYIAYTTLRVDDTLRAVSLLAGYAPLLDELSNSFDRHVSDLYEVLKGSAQSTTYRQLLTRLNFNKFYSSQ